MSLEINEETIEEELIHDELNHVISGLAHLPSEEEKLTILETVKENLIYKTLLRQEAEKLDLTIPVEHIEREYQLFFKSPSAPTPRTTIEIEKVKSFITQKLKESALIENICKDLLTPTPAHLETFYKDNLEYYFVAKQYHYVYAGFTYKNPTHHQELYDLLEQTILSFQSNQSQNPLSLDSNDSSESNSRTQPLRAMLQNILSRKKFSDSLLPQTIVAEYKTNLPALSQDGFSLLNHLDKSNSHSESKSYKHFTPLAISKITDVAPDTLLFNPIKNYNSPSSPTSTTQLGLYVLSTVRENFTPNFQEVAEQVEKDLREQMEQIQTRLFLRKKMEESTIKDISYL